MLTNLLRIAMSRCFRLLSVAALAVLLVGSAVPHAAQAQGTRTLIIQDGTVYLDGQRVPSDQLPSSLNVSNLNVRYSFSGISRPVVELNGALYAVGDSLEPVDPNAVSARQSTVSLHGTASQAESGRAAASNADESTVRASQLQQYQAQYLEEMQRRHKELYDRLMRERRMEAQTYDLARTIRQLPQGEQRQRFLDSLRTTLNEIFELKQENRRREIQQLENQITELRRRLEKREEMREQMIEQRIQQLIGESDDSQ